MIAQSNYPLLQELFAKPDKKSKFYARQIMFNDIPPSMFVETYLYNNEGRPQKLDLFPMMRQIYDYMPRRLLLKCSRKTLKSTLLSNIITLNLIRLNNYHMLYVAPQELTTKGFSNNYLAPRLESPPLKRILGGWRKNDVFEKILKDTESSVILRYVKDDATRCRGPATDQNIHDEIQDIYHSQLPIIRETMAISPIKREIFAGTPLTTDNTINKLWLESCQMEWMTKCTGCNHWNSLTEGNEPLKMIRKEGYSCSKCGKLLDTSQGEWVMFEPTQTDLIGFHLAQPMLPYYNQNERGWEEIYKEVHLKENYSKAQIYNEKFGIAYDSGVKLITKEELQKCCVLGPMIKDGLHQIYKEHQYKYRAITAGVDWGVNPAKARTAIAIGGLRDDLVYEVFFAKIFMDIDWGQQIEEIAKLIKRYDCLVAADSGPDPYRGIELIQKSSNVGSLKGQLVRYEHGQLVQHYMIPSGSVDWRQHRWCLHRTDTLSFVVKLLKQQRILFPQWEDLKPAQFDILAEFVEMREGLQRQEMFYRHPDDQPDDFLHALNFAVCQAFVWAQDPTLTGPSSSVHKNLDE